MLCDECARDGTGQPAVAYCRFCLVGLCKRHLVESFHSGLAPSMGASTISSARS